MGRNFYKNLMYGCTVCVMAAGTPSHLLINTTELDRPGRVSRVELVSLYGDLLNAVPTSFDSAHPALYNTTAFIPPDDFFYLKVTHSCFLQLR